MLLSTQEYKWVTCDGLASYPGGIEIFLVVLILRKLDWLDKKLLFLFSLSNGSDHPNPVGKFIAIVFPSVDNIMTIVLFFCFFNITHLDGLTNSYFALIFNKVLEVEA